MKKKYALLALSLTFVISTTSASFTLATSSPESPLSNGIEWNPDDGEQKDDIWVVSDENPIYGVKVVNGDLRNSGNITVNTVGGGMLKIGFIYMGYKQKVDPSIMMEI